MTILVLRGLVVLAALLSLDPLAFANQASSVLHIKVVLLDAERKTMPVPHHALLISDNPSSAPPRLVVTGLDGTADVRLGPGNYTVESDRPFVLNGKAYQWTQMLDIVGGHDAVLELSAENAEVAPASAETAAAGSAVEADSSSVMAQWQNAVVRLWTPTTLASGFLIDTNGLIATYQRAIGTATSVEVQLAPDVKVAAKILAADPGRDVAVLRVDPAAVASVKPISLGCAEQTQPSVANGQEIFAVEVPLDQQKDTTSGTVSRVESHAILSDIVLATGGAGGPVFTAGGGVVGITSPGDESAGGRRGSARVVRIGDACEVVASAERKMKDAAPPDSTHLPVEPAQPFPVDVLKDIVRHRAGSLNPYQIASADFDIAFITPVQIYGAQYQTEQAGRQERDKGARAPDLQQSFVRPLMDFANWSEYVADLRPVLLVRVTPKLVEGFWTKVARGAAQTQGVALPPMKRFKSGFLRMRAFCGDAEITPIHPFKLEQHVSENDTIYEGLYVFDPGAIAPSCAGVKLMLYSEKEPEKADTQVVDAKLVQQIWQDFAPYRTLR